MFCYGHCYAITLCYVILLKTYAMQYIIRLNCIEISQTVTEISCLAYRFSAVYIRQSNAICSRLNNYPSIIISARLNGTGASSVHQLQVNFLSDTHLVAPVVFHLTWPHLLLLGVPTSCTQAEARINEKQEAQLMPRQRDMRTVGCRRSAQVHIFPYPGIPGYYEPGRIGHAGTQLKRRHRTILAVVCRYPVFVAPSDHNPPTLETNRQTDVMLVA